MAIVLTIWSFIAGGYGVIVLGASQSAVHEIQAGLAFLIATVAFGSAAIIEAVKKNGALTKTDPLSSD